MKSTLFGNGVARKERTLADLEAGDQIAVCHSNGEFIRMAKVAKKTDKALWTGTHRFGERYAFSGKQVQGRYSCRIPTQADIKKHKAQKAKAAQEYQRQQRIKELEAHEEYQLAKDIGYMLCDFDHGSPAKYLAFAKRIGLERLRAFNDSIKEAKDERAPN